MQLQYHVELRTRLDASLHIIHNSLAYIDPFWCDAGCGVLDMRPVFVNYSQN